MKDGSLKSLLRRLPGGRRLIRYRVQPSASWRGPPGAPKVLIEEDDGALREAMATALESAGYQTAACAGPGRNGKRSCPLSDGANCRAVDAADVVVQVLAPHNHAMDEVRKAIQDHDPDLSIAVIAPSATAARHPDLVEGTHVWTGPISSTGVVAAVAEALTRAAS